MSEWNGEVVAFAYKEYVFVVYYTTEDIRIKIGKNSNMLIWPNGMSFSLCCYNTRYSVHVH
jgi:hypothetical protein